MRIVNIPEYEGPTARQVIIVGGVFVAILAVAWFSAKAITRS